MNERAQLSDPIWPQAVAVLGIVGLYVGNEVAALTTVASDPVIGWGGGVAGLLTGIGLYLIARWHRQRSEATETS